MKQAAKVAQAEDFIADLDGQFDAFVAQKATTFQEVRSSG